MGLGNSKEVKSRGAPTAIDFSPDGDHIIAGHESGQIALWDLLSKQCLKLITETPVPPSPITSIRFVRRGPKFSFIAADRDGTVDLYTISKYVFAYDYHSSHMSSPLTTTIIMICMPMVHARIGIQQTSNAYYKAKPVLSMPHQYD
jgi:WD40 repeat protein